MRIQELTLTNFKGRTVLEQVFPVTVWRGANDSGKTARLDAVRTVLNGGYHPEMEKAGKGLGQTAELLSGAKAAAKLLIDGALVGAEYACERNAWRMTKAPAMDKVPLMKPAAEFFAMSGPAQMRHVFAMVKTEDTEETIAEKIVAQKEAMQPRTDKTDEVFDDWAETARVTGSQRHGTFNEWLLEYSASVGKRKLEVEQDQRRYEGANKVTTAMREQRERITVNMPATDLRIQELETRRDVVATRIGEIRGQTQPKATSDPVGLEQALQFVGDNPLEVLESAKTAAEQELARVNEGFVVDYQEQEPAARRLRDDATLALRQAVQTVTDIKAKIGDLKAELADLLTGDCCPKCKGRSKKWKEQAEAEYGKEIADAEAAMKRAESTVVQRQSELKAQEDQWMTARNADTEHRDKLSKRGELRDDVKINEQLIAQFHAAQRTIDANKPPEPNPELEAELAKLTAEADGLQRDLLAAKVDRDAMVQEKGRIEEGLQIDIKRADNDDEIRALKVIIATVAEFQEDTVAKSLRGLLEKVNAVTVGIIPEPIEFRDGELGRWKTTADNGRPAKQWVSHRAFGQTYQAVAYIGLAVALAAQNAFKLVVFDELGVVDQENRPKVIRRMIELWEAGTIDQFLGASPTTITEPVLHPEGPGYAEICLQ